MDTYLLLKLKNLGYENARLGQKIHRQREYIKKLKAELNQARESLEALKRHTERRGLQKMVDEANKVYHPEGNSKVGLYQQNTES